MNSTRSHSTETPFRFSASRIAAALNKTDRALRLTLKNIPASGEIMVGGHRAKAWAFCELPAALQKELDAQARTAGCADAHALLSVAPGAWQPPAKLSQLAASALDKALQLQRALLPMLDRRNDLTITAADFAVQGVEQYRRVFGHTITPQYWRTLLNRTLARDSGAQHWTRLEIYLDENPTFKTAAPVASAADTLANHELSRLLLAFKNPAAPTPGETECLWVHAFELLEKQIADGKPAKKAKRALLNFLSDRAPFLADTPRGLFQQFERKYRRWIAGDRRPSAIADQRPEKSGWHRAPELSTEDKDKLVGHSVLFHGGRVSQAWRELVQSGELSEELLQHYLHNPASKSHVPRHIRDVVSTDVALLNDIHHGPRQAQLNGAHISRDWSDVYAGDWYQADDCTLPIYYYEPDGNGWHQLWRGQFLLMIDVRSLRILGFALLSSRNYNALAIRTLITRTCDEHGLPRQGFYFEGGIWKNSKIITGDKSPFSLSEAENGLKDLGLRFVHARLPRGKVIERVLGMMQDLMEGFPGYAGRDERHDRFERVQKAKLQVETRKLEPDGHFLSADQWLAELENLCAKYNAAVQNGKLLVNQSPDDAWSKLANPADPQIKFDANCRYLLAHHRRPVKVTKNGITLRFGKKVFNYRNEQTGRLIGQTVLAWFNPDAPEVLCVTGQDRKNPFAVAQSYEPPAMDATPEQMDRAVESVSAHQAHAKTYYRTLSSKFPRDFRRNLVSGETSALGETFQRQGEAAQAAVESDRQFENRSRKASADGMPAISRHDPARDEKLSAAEELRRLDQLEENQL